MKLNKLLDTDLDIDIKGITDDSRLVKKDYLFVATKGYNVDHYDYIDDAIKNGCSFIITDRKIEYNIPYQIVNDLDKCYQDLCLKFYDLGIKYRIYCPIYIIQAEEMKIFKAQLHNNRCQG